MFPGKADLFLRKWEGNIVPKLQKMSTVKNPLVMPTDNESEGRLLCSFCQNVVFLSVDSRAGRYGQNFISRYSSFDIPITIYITI